MRSTEQDFALILRKAGELQDRPGVTAAGELDAGHSTRLTRVLGGSAHHRLERSVQGTLPAASYPGASPPSGPPRISNAVRSAGESERP